MWNRVLGVRAGVFGRRGWDRFIGRRRFTRHVRRALDHASFDHGAGLGDHHRTPATRRTTSGRAATGLAAIAALGAAADATAAAGAAAIRAARRLAARAVAASRAAKTEKTSLGGHSTDTHDRDHQRDQANKSNAVHSRQLLGIAKLQTAKMRLIHKEGRIGYQFGLGRQREAAAVAANRSVSTGRRLKYERLVTQFRPAGGACGYTTKQVHGIFINMLFDTRGGKWS